MRTRRLPTPGSGERQRHAAARIREESLRLIGSSGCPLCREAARGEENFFEWFVVESYTQLEVLRRLQSGLGMCAAHTRALLAAGGSTICVPVFRDVVRAGLSRLAEPQPLGPCLACEKSRWHERHVTLILAAGLEQREVLDAYCTSDGLCMPHTLDLLAEVSPVIAAYLATDTVARLENEHAVGAAPPIARRDLDAERRQETRAALASLDLEPASGRNELEHRLALGCCPLCLARGHTEHQYLEWLLAEHDKRGDGVREDIRSLCGTHIHDVLADDPEAAHWLLGPQRALFRAGLLQFIESLAALPPDGALPRLRALQERVHVELAITPRRSSGRRRALHWAVSSRVRGASHAHERLRRVKSSCRACDAAETAERRERELLLACTRDAAFMRRYEQGHGVCARHALSMLSSSEGDAVRRVLDARLAILAILAWELDEANRKRSWSFRHESDGDEETAWLRATAQLDGQVFFGAPAKQLRAEARPIRTVDQEKNGTVARTGEAAAG
jgi:hypothetical protein